MGEITTEETKYKNYFYYYSSGKIIKSKKELRQLPKDFFRLIETERNVVMKHNNCFFLKQKKNDGNEYNGIYVREILKLLETFDYVSHEKCKEQFIGHKELNMRNFEAINKVYFKSASAEEKIEVMNKLFKIYNLSRKESKSSFVSIPVPSIFDKDLIVAMDSKSVHLQHYYKTLEEKLDHLRPDSKWIVCDSIELLIYKFENYFSTDLQRSEIIKSSKMENVDFGEAKRKSDLFLKILRKPIGYTGYLQNSKSIKLTSVQFSRTKIDLISKLRNEYWARYIQNIDIEPLTHEKSVPQIMQAYTIENLEDCGILLFSFSTKEVQK